ncbi:hypothetical protein D3C73_659450 [compost metagenome]
MEPVFEGGSFTLFEYIHKWGKGPARMVEHCIQQHADSAFVAGGDQLFQRLYITKMRIDRHIVFRIVFVVGGRGEDRGEVDAGNAELAQMIQMVNDPLQVAAEKVLRCRRSAPRLHIGRIPAGIAICKPLRENLIKDSVLHPGRRSKNVTTVYVREFKQPVGIRRTLSHKLTFCHPDALMPFLQQKSVFQPPVRGHRRTLPIIEHCI